jgi:chemotaxis protein histidine kinase CheA
LNPGRIKSTFPGTLQTEKASTRPALLPKTGETVVYPVPTRKELIAVSDSNLDFLDIYFEEVGDHFADLEDLIRSLSKTPGDTDAATSLRRLAHTMKNSAGLMRFKAIQALSKALETAMDQVKAGKICAGSGIETVCSAFETLHRANLRLKDTGVEDEAELAETTRIIDELL